MQPFSFGKQQQPQPFGSTGSGIFGSFGGGGVFGQNTQPKQQSGFTFGISPTATVTSSTATTPSSGTSTIGNTGFGTNAFGTPSQQQQPASFSFGVNSNILPTLGAGGGLFGAPKPAATALGAFSGIAPTLGTGTGGFRFGTSQQQPAVGTITCPTFGGLGTNTGGLPQHPVTFGVQPQQQVAVQPANFVDEQGAFHNSLFNCCKFGDERDGVLANLNYIQACWGCGNGHYNQANAPVSYNNKNVLYRFKDVCYSFLFNSLNEDGNVMIQIKKPHAKVYEQETQLIGSIQTIIAKPNIDFKISGCKALTEDSTMIILTALDRMSLRTILATDLAQALLQPQFKVQLETLGITSVTPKIRPSPTQLQAYLDSPAAGLDPCVWKMAQENNPDPDNMVPMPLLGPAELKCRLQAQIMQGNQHAERLRIIKDELTTLHNWNVNIETEIKQINSRFSFIHHTYLAALIKSVILQYDTSLETEVKKRLEELKKALKFPVNLRGRLNELMLRNWLQKSQNLDSAKYTVTGPFVEQTKYFLNQQQDSIVQLAETIKSCMDLLQQMNEDICEFREQNILR